MPSETTRVCASDSSALDLERQLTSTPIWGAPKIRERLHDAGHSAWWLIAQFVAAADSGAVRFAARTELRLNHVGASALLLTSVSLSIVVIILYARKGDPGPNRYGDPAPITPG